MRISTAWTQQLSVNTMSNRENNLSKLQQQLSSGLRVTVPADDPAAAVRILDLESTMAKTTQYQSNISTVRGRLNLEESALQTSTNILGRAKELTMQGMNDSLNSSDRLSLKFEVDQLIEEMAGIANSKNASGEFIFSGDLSTAPAFALNAATGEYVYQGGLQQRALQISPTRQVADGDLGFNVFENIQSSSRMADENGKRSIFNTMKSLSEGLAATFNASPGEITGDRFLRYGLDYTDPASPPIIFSLTATAENTLPPLFPTVPPTPIALSPVSIDLSGKQFAGVEDLVTEVNNQLAATSFLPADMAPNTNIPVGADYSSVLKARSNGNRIEFVSVATGAVSSVTINNNSGTFLTDAGFAEGQTKTGVDISDTLPALTPEVFQQKLGEVLTDIDYALDSFLEARTRVGVRLNVLDDQEAHNEKFIVDTQGTLSVTRDLDYADAISKFELQATALQAAQQTFAKVNGLSLFNYI